jgi:hypothetical protein
VPGHRDCLRRPGRVDDGGGTGSLS